MDTVNRCMDLPFIVGTSPTLGIRGLIATRAIAKGELVESCQIILIPKIDEEKLFSTVLVKYYFEWTKSHHCIVLGYGSLINHSYKPNVKYFHDFRNMIMNFRTISAVQPGEELSINYNWDPEDMTPLDDRLLDYNKHFSDS